MISACHVLTRTPTSERSWLYLNLQQTTTKATGRQVQSRVNWKPRGGVLQRAYRCREKNKNTTRFLIGSWLNLAVNYSGCIPFLSETT